MGRLRIWTIAVFVVAAGCTKGVPKFEELGSEQLPPPVFTPNSVSMTDFNQTISVSGTCSTKADDMTFNINGVHLWNPGNPLVDSGALNVDCKNSGTFSFTMKSVNALNAMGSPPPWDTSQTGVFYLEARTVLIPDGVSTVAKLTVNFVVPSATNPERFRITQGGGKASNANYSVKASVHWRSPAKAGNANYSIVPSSSN
jgi:hypothetical protein